MDIGIGPFSARATVSMPISLRADVCQSMDLKTQVESTECFNFFVHPEGDETSYGHVRHQNADVRPTSATLVGKIEFATTGGWSPLVAASVASTFGGLAVLSGVLLMLWRLLAAAAAGDVFSSRTVRWVRGIGWLVIAATLANPVSDFLRAFLDTDTQSGYSMEAFGVGTWLDPMPLGPAGLNLGQLALGGLVLIVAEIFRYGATIEADRKLTI
ncbi:MAG TPA: DUF2975 domain-containing protein [Microlunatus sp.]